MENSKHSLPLSAYGTQTTGWQQVGEKYRGVISCSTEIPSTEESSYDFVDETLWDTKEQAMTAARNLHHRLAMQDERTT